MSDKMSNVVQMFKV